MNEFLDWLTTTPLGLAAALGGLIVFFALVAVLYERKTRKLYPDRNRRGTKATAKAKAKAKAKRAQAEATKSKEKEAATEQKRKEQEPKED